MSDVPTICPVCGGDRFEERVIASLTIRRCVSCGLRISGIVATKGTNYAEVDDRAYLESIGRVRRAQGEEIVALVAKHVEAGEWLDVGCGFGYLLEAARSAGFRVRGIEPNADAAKAARERVDDVQQILLDESTPPADVVSTLDVLEHVDDINAFARLVKQKARRLWVIKVPSSEGLFFRIAHAFRIASAVKRLWQSEYASPHTVYFGLPALTRFLGNHGFEVIASRYLDEVPDGTVADRLTLDGRMPRWKARLAVPLFFAINRVERMRGKSDALVVIARVSAP